MLKISKNQKLLAAGVSVLAVMLMCIWFLGVKTPAYAVEVNGKQQFIVKDRSQVDAAVKQIGKQMAQNSSQAVLSSKIDYKLVFAKKDMVMAEDEIQPALQKELLFQTNGAVIMANGQKVACVKDKTTAEDILKKLKSAYSWVGENEKLVSADFAEKVAVTETKVYAGEVLTPQQAWDLITTGTDSPEKYKVKEGDNLWSIARKNDMYVDDILKANHISEDDILDLGQELILVKSKPYINVIAKVEGNGTEVIPFETKVVTDSSVANGIKVQSAGVNGKKQVSYVLEKINNVIDKKDVISETIIEKPKDKVMVKGSRVVQVASRSGGGSGSLMWPVSGYISQYFGRHTGIDIAGSTGSTVVAADGGTVTFAGWNGGYGNCILINHGNGLSTRYAHCSKLYVSVGQSVARGQSIGARGSTGNSTGPHLHFEVLSGGKFVNPLNYLR